MDFKNDAVGRRLAQKRSEKGFGTATEFARAYGLTYETYQKHENGERGFKIDKAIRYARILGVHPWWLLTGVDVETKGPDFAVPVSFHVGAGDDVQAFDDGPIDWIKADEFGSMEAAIVQGHSMRPDFDDGDRILFDPADRHPPDDLLHQPSIVHLTDDRRLLKQVQRGATPGRWDLISSDPAFAPILDVEVDWATPVVMRLSRF